MPLSYLGKFQTMVLNLYQLTTSNSCIRHQEAEWRCRLRCLPLSKSISGFIGFRWEGTCLEATIIRIMGFGGLYWGPLFLGKLPNPRPQALKPQSSSLSRAVTLNPKPKTFSPRCLHYQWHSFGFVAAVGIMGLATPGRAGGGWAQYPQGFYALYKRY